MPLGICITMVMPFVKYSTVPYWITGIIHGDIKPQSLLIFEENSRIIAKVADFGYATCFQDDSSRISIPKSEPWNAPEHHDQQFRPLEAKRMDVYSFALLCAWLLFEAGSSDKLQLPSDIVRETSKLVGFGIDEPEKNLLQLWKRDHKLVDWVYSLVYVNSHLNDSTKDCLTSFFRSTLTFEPRLRCIEFGQLLDLLAPSRYVPTSLYSQKLHLTDE